MAIDDVASRDVVGTPQGIEDLLAPERLAWIGRKKVEESLLNRRQPRTELPDLDVLIKEVDLQAGDVDDRDERDSVAVAPPHQGEGAGHELLGHERHGDDVVRAPIEGGELCLQIPADAEDDRRDPSVRNALSDQVQPVGVVSIEIDEEKMRPPALERGLRALGVFGD